MKVSFQTSDNWYKWVAAIASYYLAMRENSAWVWFFALAVLVTFEVTIEYTPKQKKDDIHAECNNI